MKNQSNTMMSIMNLLLTHFSVMEKPPNHREIRIKRIFFTGECLMVIGASVVQI
ncbi:capsule polysaccharide export inner-membrane protein BexB [Streptococcus sanguinis SK1 = NCTC 7863]|uniref:Capsule polysaccharide export inner-membrane protein BexB n=2 Tax=Streptococcus sanguinis TaxID=1305 RepID=F3SKD0_STRSA|nr:hypothetical protein HMPREF9390_2035 [Streptococcus sanguinis SK405]EGF05936.1 capsule polysaccharide export inner-membrane protein BexB [Streptococcus sanguinis SK1 = NCTC 7863]EGG39531.1 capsule polysaccharide export inner-membrane protein BexB [Streptococcus sanguinis SK1087]